ncbi:beta-lactamase family protein [Nonomuraea sp. NN258]|uniref:serine hydrolase domain-containing protein n=1 Tax=Nonomuraea antri TaxID=2730852 RepID=UPI0015688C95|nr:serine hydrolase domain-containing protein [Nonomuraea antri]NRQ37875.1 beta-lactamase family protein [Nonomuraea antri]
MARSTPSAALLLVVLAAVAAAGLALLVAPRPPELGVASTGDRALAAAVRLAAGDGHHRGLSVALVDGGVIRTAGVGDGGGPEPRPVDAGTPYELGSVGKALTGLLLADLAADGLPPDTPVRDLLPGVRFSDPGTGSATLAELASHRSGLPRLRTTPGSVLRGSLSTFTGLDPYGAAGPDAVLDDAAAVSVSPERKGQVVYSNLGMALLGQALAERFGGDYPRLLRERVLGPLGMHTTGVLGPDDPLPAGHAHGYRGNGLPAAPWRDHGYAGAGGALWGTAADLGRLLQGVLSGTAPGLDATTPRFTENPSRRIGYGWFTDRRAGREITWHNGTTGGHAAYVGYDRTSGRGVAVLGNTDASVDGIGLRLLGLDGSDRDERPPYAMVGVTLLFTFAGAELLVRVLRGSGLDRLGVVASALWAAFLLLVAHAAGTWQWLPPVLWAVGSGVVVAGVAAAVSRWRRLPVRAKGHRWARWAGVALPAASLLLMSALLITT